MPKVNPAAVARTDWCACASADGCLRLWTMSCQWVGRAQCANERRQAVAGMLRPQGRLIGALSQVPWGIDFRLLCGDGAGSTAVDWRGLWRCGSVLGSVALSDCRPLSQER